ncbi:MAG: hypothetical protein M1823_001675 [Watsoniomyces obsoletus]|nr:MAG: hypothetical protein M1823_001675 [Watsoniomyces obsoletus]
MPLLPGADYVRRLDIINRGFSGYNTSQGLKALPEFMPTPEQAKVSFMTVFFGANDACLPDSGEGKSQHVPLERYRENLVNIIEHPMVKAHNPRIILIAPPPVDEYQFGRDKKDRRAEHTKAYADVVWEIGTAHDVPVIDLWTLFMTKAGWSREGTALPGSKDTTKNEALRMLLSDGVHLAPEGYRILYDELQEVIRGNWSDQVPDQLPWVLPAWQEAPSE